MCHSSEGEKLRDKVELPVVHFGISATYCCLIKRCLILGRKIMTNLDSILKIRDITLSTKVCLVKAMVFSVVMYGCKSWSIKKLNAKELMLLNCGIAEDS